jgi:phospholipid transport system substrate-binding protein
LRRCVVPVTVWAMSRSIAAVVLAAALATAAWAASPAEEVRQYTDQVQKILDDPNLRQTDKRAAVRKVAAEIFDVNETAKRALGRHWQNRTPAEREEFTQLFADLLERTYINKIDLYRGEKLVYTGETIDGEFATVRAKVVTRQGTEVPVEAKLNRKDGRWLVYDLSVENISLIANYRSQFDRIIRTSSYQDLVTRLKTKRDEFLAPRETRPAAAR